MEVLDKLFDPSILIFVVGGLVGIVAIVSYQLNSYFKTRKELELKETMVEQGRSADEIERVLRAGRDLPDRKAAAREVRGSPRA